MLHIKKDFQQRKLSRVHHGYALLLSTVSDDIVSLYYSMCLYRNRMSVISDFAHSRNVMHAIYAMHLHWISYQDLIQYEVSVRSYLAFIALDPTVYERHRLWYMGVSVIWGIVVIQVHLSFNLQWVDWAYHDFELLEVAHYVCMTIIACWVDPWVAQYPHEVLHLSVQFLTLEYLHLYSTLHLQWNLYDQRPISKSLSK